MREQKREKQTNLLTFTGEPINWKRDKYDVSLCNDEAYLILIQTTLTIMRDWGNVNTDQLFYNIKELLFFKCMLNLRFKEPLLPTDT